MNIEYTNLENKVREAGEALRETYKDRLKSGGISATGKLFDSVGYRLEVNEGDIYLYFKAEDYYIHIEKGRKPNSQMPPVEAIRKWMIARGIPDKPGTAFVIARSIGKKGIKPKPFLRESKIEIKEYEVQFKEALTIDIEKFIKENVKDKIKVQIKN